MKMLSRTEQEKQWRTESDARTIEHYMEVCADEERSKLAYEYLEKKKTEIEAALASAASNNLMNAIIRSSGVNKG